MVDKKMAERMLSDLFDKLVDINSEKERLRKQIPELRRNIRGTQERLKELNCKAGTAKGSIQRYRAKLGKPKLYSRQEWRREFYGREKKKAEAEAKRH